MSLVGHDVVVEITGTKKSRVLDSGEIQMLEFSKTEKLRDDFQDVNDLLEHILSTAFMSGDAIFRLLVDGEDVVKRTVASIIVESGFNLDNAFHEVYELPFLTNADPSDVYDLMQGLSIN